MEKYFRCECYSEGIQIERDIEIFDYEKEAWGAQVYFAKLHYGTNNNMPTLKEKIRYCWRILKTGRTYVDEIIFSVAKARELGNYLLEITDEENIKREVQSRIKKHKDNLTKRNVSDKNTKDS